MPFRVNNNITALNAQQSISRNNSLLNQNLERLSSGMRINKAADDAAGLEVSEGLRAELAGLNQNVRNAEQAGHMLQVAEGSMSEVTNILVRMKELALQASSSTQNDKNRESTAAEFNQLRSEIDRIVQATTYNGETLLTGFGSRVGSASTAVTTSNATGVVKVSLAAAQAGTYTFDDSTAGELILGNGATSQSLSTGTILDGTVVEAGATVIANFDRLGIQVVLAGAGAGNATGDYAKGDLDSTTIVVEGGTGGVFQVGPREDVVNRIEIGINDLRPSNLNLGSLTLNSLTTARESLEPLDMAVAAVSNERLKLGSVQNRLQFTINYSQSEIESIQASEASIRDADVALEVTDLSRRQILMQTANAMLVQSNVTPAIQALTLI